jgi:hypothetical protein
MRTRLFLPIALACALFSVGLTAAAHEAPPSADAISVSAHQTASSLRHRWDKARTQDGTVAACLEGKMMQAISVAKRVDEHRLALRSIADAAERARRLAAIDRLGERTLELSSEANACDPAVAFAMQLGTQVETKTSGNIALVDADVPEQPGGFPPSIWSALLRLR